MIYPGNIITLPIVCVYLLVCFLQKNCPGLGYPLTTAANNFIVVTRWIDGRMGA